MIKPLNPTCSSEELFHFVDEALKRRGWGRALRRAVADWYWQRNPQELLICVLDGTHAQIREHLRLWQRCHAAGDTAQQDVFAMAQRIVARDWAVWYYLLHRPSLPPRVLLRHLGAMTASGWVVGPQLELIRRMLRDISRLRVAGITARDLQRYQTGKDENGTVWVPVPALVAELEAAAAALTAH